MSDDIELSKALARIEELERELAEAKEQVKVGISWEETAEEQARQLAEAKDDYNEVALERDQLKADLRKYEPSDAMMYRLLELRTTINDAAALFEQAKSDDMSFRLAPSSTVLPETWEAIDAWLDRHRNSGHTQRKSPNTTLALHEAIERAAYLIDRWRAAGPHLKGLIEGSDEWLASPTVQAARKALKG